MAAALEELALVLSPTQHLENNIGEEKTGGGHGGGRGRNDGEGKRKEGEE